MMMMVFLMFFMFMFSFLNFNKNMFSNFIFLLSFMYLFNFNKFNEYMKINEFLGLSNYSFMLIMLTFWIFGIIFMFFEVNKFDLIYYKILMIMLLMSLIFVFMSMSLMLFYFMFESSLIFTYMIIMKWGMGEMRKLAGFYLLFYTMFFSLPFLLFVLNLNFKFMVLNFYYMEFLKINFLNLYMFIFFMFTFFVKIPMFMLHYWLLKAHVEAPVIGSMILAAILLKLGVYGLIRFMIIFPFNFNMFSKIILYLSIFGSMIISILCIRQIDLKILVAYSSVVHMGLLLSSLMTFFNFGVKGSYMMMISHGLCSSGLFFLVNLCYLMSNSRLMLMNKGLMNINPSMSLMWFLLCSSNLSAPISLNLVSEIILLISLMNWNYYIFFILVILMFFSFLYSLNLFCYTQHGDFNKFQNLMNFKLIDYFILLMHWIPLNLFVFNLLLFF